MNKIKTSRKGRDCGIKMAYDKKVFDIIGILVILYIQKRKTLEYTILLYTLVISIPTISRCVL